MDLKKYWLRISMLIFTFCYACVGTAEYGSIKDYFFSGDAVQSPGPASSCREMVEGKRILLKNAGNVTLDGEYRMAGILTPQNFADIRSLRIETRWYDPRLINGNLSGVIDLRGSLNGSIENRFAWFSSTPVELAFETKAVDAVSFRFVGAARGWVNANQDQKSIQISGTLYKLKQGRIEDSMYAVFQNGCGSDG